MNRTSKTLCLHVDCNNQILIFGIYEYIILKAHENCILTSFFFIFGKIKVSSKHPSLPMTLWERESTSWDKKLWTQHTLFMRFLKNQTRGRRLPDGWRTISKHEESWFHSNPPRPQCCEPVREWKLRGAWLETWENRLRELSCWGEGDRSWELRVRKRKRWDRVRAGFFREVFLGYQNDAVLGSPLTVIMIISVSQ